MVVKASDLPTYIPLSEAANRYRLDRQVLTQLVESGKIGAVRSNGGNGEVLVAENEISAIKDSLDQFAKREDFEHLANRRLGIREASRKYDVPTTTLYRWSRKSFIERVGVDGRKVMLNEADVAYCSAIYHQKNGGQGKRILDEDGNPYVPKSERVATT